MSQELLKAKSDNQDWLAMPDDLSDVARRITLNQSSSGADVISPLYRDDSWFGVAWGFSDLPPSLRLDLERLT